jgi:hypothetical protein
MVELFLSHSSADRHLASFIEETLRAAIPGLEVFRTTRVEQIPAGKAWFEVVADHLRSADRVLVLLTPTSVDRPWINFEAGAGWIGNKVVVPAVAGMSKEEVPEPLRSLQTLSLEQPAEAKHIFEILGGTLQDAPTFVAAVRNLAAAAVREAMGAEGWAYIDFEDKRYAWDGPFDQLAKGNPVPVRPGLIERLRAAGLDTMFVVTDLVFNEQARGYVQLFEIDRLKRLHEIIVAGQNVLLVRTAENTERYG